MTTLALPRSASMCAVNRSTVQMIVVMAVLVTLASLCAQAQTFTVLHSFTGGGDGFQPYAGLTIDQGGNLYGTTTQSVRGTVFQMKHRGDAWTLSTLYQFDYGEWIPQSRVVQGPGGALYGTTSTGGNSENCTEFGCGTVYDLRPPQTICRSVSCRWSAAIVSLDGNDGWEPGFVDPAFDAAGNMYVTTIVGVNGDGNVVQLTRSGGAWTSTSIHDFSGADGDSPYSGVTLDAQGTLYGTTWMGGSNNVGTVYRLARSGSGWTLDTLYTFHGADGANPVGGLVFDQAGNLYGTTEYGGAGNGGTVFELSPTGGGWNFTLLHSFTGMFGPLATLTFDAAGNLYGTTYSVGAFGEGSVFKLTRNNGSWNFTGLYDFTGGADGANPVGGVTLDAAGNLYGTASAGGLENNCTYQGNPGCGVVWKITP